MLFGMVRGLVRSRLPAVGMKLVLLAVLEVSEQVVVKNHQPKVLQAEHRCLESVVLVAAPLVSLQAVALLRFLLVNSRHLVAYIPFSNRFNAYLQYSKINARGILILQYSGFSSNQSNVFS